MSSGLYTSPQYTKLDITRPILQAATGIFTFATELEARSNCSKTKQCSGYVANTSAFETFMFPTVVESALTTSTPHYVAAYKRDLPVGVAGFDGTYVPCFKCTAGHGPNEFQDACIECPAGQFSATEGVNCTRCPLGRYTDNAGQSQCTLCAEGQSTFAQGSSTSCEQCPPGQYNRIAGAECTACPSGKYQNTPGQLYCFLCTASSISNVSAATCTNCTAGHTASADRTTCKACQGGQRWASKTSPGCEQCPAGQFGSEDSCVNCTIGQYGPSIGLGCLNCSAGFYQATEGQTACVQCPQGNYSSSPGSNKCAPCQPGRFSALPQRMLCNECPRGKHQPSGGSNQCLECDGTNTTVTKGQQTCNTPCTDPLAFDASSVFTGVIYRIENTTTNTTVQSNGNVPIQQVTKCGVTLKLSTMDSSGRSRLPIASRHAVDFVTYVRFVDAGRRRLNQGGIDASVVYGRMCQYTPWGSFGNCDASCRTSDTQVVTKIRSRSVRFAHPPDNSCTQLIQNGSCSKPRCPINCLLTQWGQYGPCTASCGGGVRTRARTLVQANAFEVEPCGAFIETTTDQCGPEHCPIDCLTTQESITECTKTCGTGQQYVKYRVTRPSRYGGAVCKNNEYVNCSTQPCPGQLHTDTTPLAAATVVIGVASMGLLFHALTNVLPSARKNAKVLPAKRRQSSQTHYSSPATDETQRPLNALMILNGRCSLVSEIKACRQLMPSSALDQAFLA